MTAEEYFLHELPLIEEIVGQICRRKGMQPDDIEEFLSEVKVRLIENDYAVIRAFRHRSSFGTYMAAVASRLLLDYRIREWGKWNASAAARRLGEIAVELERLLYRDERSLDDAFALLRLKYPRVTRTDIETLAEKLPPRVRRRRIDLEVGALELPAPTTFSAEQTSVAKRVSEAVCDLLTELPDKEQLMLRLRFDVEMSVPQIARALQFETYDVYRQLRRLFRDLRAKLEAAGIRGSDIEELIGSDAAILDFHLRSEGTLPPPIFAEHEDSDAAVIAVGEEW